jgi:hypothetical protein
VIKNKNKIIKIINTGRDKLRFLMSRSLNKNNKCKINKIIKKYKIHMKKHTQKAT